MFKYDITIGDEFDNHRFYQYAFDDPIYTKFWCEVETSMAWKNGEPSRAEPS